MKKKKRTRGIERRRRKRTTGKRRGI